MMPDDEQIASLASISIQQQRGSLEVMRLCAVLLSMCIEKGVFTLDEFERMKASMSGVFDQTLEDMARKALRERFADNPGEAMMAWLLTPKEPTP